jgi:hypothetical protein
VRVWSADTLRCVVMVLRRVCVVGVSCVLLLAGYLHARITLILYQLNIFLVN